MKELPELKSHKAYNPWIPTDEPPENIDWDKMVLVLEYESEIPVVMTMAEVFMNEGSEAEYWMPIPKSPCLSCKGSGLKTDENGVVEDDVCPECDGEKDV
ncbi:hypothetical protein LCGC14_1024250 [marine sediment metagenome]|uniref:Uncharacterized protein n=1 Tax=marine sediment metagenome TaxID=412755 RepID=A0A0F9R2D1_9ZZZZ